MQIRRSYYQWNEDHLNLPVKLGQPKAKLLEEGFIKGFIEDGEEKYQGATGNPWRVHFVEDRVSRIWFNRQCNFILQQQDVMGGFYKKTEELVATYFKSLNKRISSIDEMKAYRDSPILYLIYRDRILNLVGIIKTH